MPDDPEGPRSDAPAPGPGHFAPVRYPAPDWTGRGTVTRVLPSATGSREPVGWLVRQGDALAWLPLVRPEQEGYPVKRFIDDMLRSGARQSRPARAEWDHVLTFVLHDAPRERELSEVLDEVRAARAAAAPPPITSLPWSTRGHLAPPSPRPSPTDDPPPTA
ncbi:hypothetical protein [Cellulomonas marina]|uniref:Uncharacterized protein n=1 Tax=Cellulomonas marina TaxID=988821 RepID=A0A1I0ZDN8_9CELL|nr:hypothetical protein [Cellulomonas marina]GIG30746.1 hypothetical protein Cma02nite_33460 [Cellulomonas marina]SFB23236.1 hypothetical protein SAMN05421867_110124 [Cellulomonas marina]